MRNHRLFGVVIAVLLGTSFLHQSPSSPQAVRHQAVHHQAVRHRSDQVLVAGSHLGGTDIQLTSAALPADEPAPAALPADTKTTSLALGEGLPVDMLRPVPLGTVDLASAAVPAALQASAAEGDESHNGLLRPAGTRFVKLVYAWMAYEAAHPPRPPRHHRRPPSRLRNRLRNLPRSYTPPRSPRPWWLRPRVPPPAACGPPYVTASRGASTPRTPGTATTAPTNSARRRGTAWGTPVCRRTPHPPSRTVPPSSSRRAAAGASGRGAHASSGCEVRVPATTRMARVTS